MRIVNGKRHYAAEIRAAEKMPFDGWDSYDGNNWQWYTVRYNPETDLVILDANNTGSCWGDYSTKYFNSPAEFRREMENPYSQRSVAELIGNVDEDNAAAMQFVERAFRD